jgi:hypothetical protein
MISGHMSSGVRDFLKHLAVILVAEAIMGLVVWPARTWLYSVAAAAFSKDLVVTGEWQTFRPQDGKAVDATRDLHEEADLHQFGSHVWGTTRTLKQNNHSYEVDGRMYANSLTLTYREVGDGTFDCGSILLTLAPGGDEMDGYEVGYDLQTKQVAATKYVWRRHR